MKTNYTKKTMSKSVLSNIALLILIPLFSGCAPSNLKKAEQQLHLKMKHSDMAEKKQAMNHDQHSQHDQHEPSTNSFEKRENAVAQLTENKLYKVSLFCNESPIPVRRIHDWTIHIETPDGKPVENAKVFVFGGMPMHNHEFPTIPKVKKYLGNGDYLIEGVKFNMIGHWEMHFIIDKDRKEDRVEYKIHM